MTKPKRVRIPDDRNPSMVNEDLCPSAGFLTDERQRARLAIELMKIPDEVYREVVEQVIFVGDLPDGNPGRIVEAPKGVKAMIHLGRKAEATPELFRYVVFHEIAHFNLDHPVPQTIQQEREADALAAEWGGPHPDPGKRELELKELRTV